MPAETRDALGADAGRCESRSLYISKFTDPQANDDRNGTPRKDWFDSLVRRNPASIRRADWFPETATRLHARLMSRLMVDMAGSAMENAGLGLDRFGIPFIPGSAAKGCARRMALQSLHDWVHVGNQSFQEDDLCAQACSAFKTPAEMLAAIAQAFGWVELDWKPGKKEGLFQSDFGWACGEDHQTVWKEACAIFAKRLGWRLSEESPWEKLPAFAGAVGFLPAFPNTDPGLELDVLTVHHKDYYEGAIPVATDTEEPVPVFFPTVKPQQENDYFTFPLVQLRRAEDSVVRQARHWLALGLSVFGLGAKTNAGYGWFDASNELNVSISKAIGQLSIIKNLDREYAEFLTWADDDKDEAILNLAERRADCVVWGQSRSVIFNSIHKYAEQQGIHLL